MNGIKEYESREFEAGGHKWRFSIFPDGDDFEKKCDHISAYLSIVGKSSLRVDMFTIFLYNQILDNYTCFRGKVRRFHAINTEWGFSKLISKQSFTDTSNGYLIGDNCVLGAEVFVIKSQGVIDRVSIKEVITPYKHDLVISQFSKLDPKGVWKSEQFTSGDYRWRIWLYPNGVKRVEGLYISMYLECVDSASFAAHEKVNADYCFRIKNKNHVMHYTKNSSKWFSSSGTSWGYSDFIVIGDMRDQSRGFVVDDSCHLEIEISIKAVVRDAPM